MQKNTFVFYRLFFLSLMCVITVITGCLIDTRNGYAVKDFSWELFLPPLLGSSAGLSPAQISFVKEAGYPQQFTKIFSYENGVERIDECWIYTQYKVVENFINGIFISEKVFSKTYPDTHPKNLPQHFSSKTTIEDIISRHGQPSITRKETIWNGVLKTYVFSSLYVVFNNDKIVSVTSLQ